LRENLFISLSDELILDCYRQMRAVTLKRREIEETLEYLTALLRAPGRRNDNWTALTVDMPDFYVDLREMDNRRYRRFCEETSRPYPPAPWWDENYLFSCPDFPVVNVSWEDAMAYAWWSGRSLPTSEQWERSARGPKNLPFPWGNELPTQTLANADVPSDISLPEPSLPAWQPVRADSEFPASPFGCRHMAGNVAEWCSDILEQGSSPGSFSPLRAARGGSFSSPTLFLYAWFDQKLAASARRCDIGFRCAAPSERRAP
jgi:formylglycine-generating enzyme required for sulfatase activity